MQNQSTTAEQVIPLQIDDLTVAYHERPVLWDVDLSVPAGKLMAIIGPNGAGKSTLIRLLLGQLEPDAGTVRLGTKLDVAYFDQMREQLDPSKTLAETISPGSDWIEIGTERKHIISYLADFLFPPQRAGTPVGSLSGGERNRLLLARLFARPANLLVLDEPTNDLDIESLELLEDTLQSYAGTLLLVSHDRVFLDNVVTQTLVAEADGHWQEYAGGYSDWLLQRPQPAAAADTPPVPPPTARTRKPGKKLGFKEQRELDALPGTIHALEQEQQEVLSGMQDASREQLLERCRQELNEPTVEMVKSRGPEVELSGSEATVMLNLFFRFEQASRVAKQYKAVALVKVRLHLTEQPDGRWLIDETVDLADAAEGTPTADATPAP